MTSSVYRKVEGERKDAGHGAGAGTFDGSSVPLRRWEDWERSRLRKLKREEKRRRDFERSHPTGYIAGDGDMLSARFDGRSQSQYDGSDTVSVTSSEDDQWGPQIGGYNENNSQFPPPPVGLVMPEQDSLQGAPTLGGAELEAMLNAGFDDAPSPSSSRTQPVSPAGATYPARYQLSDSSSQPHFGNGYTPVQRSTSPGVSTPTTPTPPMNSMSSAVGGEWKTHAKRRSGGRSNSAEDYGPLGPLGPGGRF